MDALHELDAVGALALIRQGPDNHPKPTAYAEGGISDFASQCWLKLMAVLLLPSGSWTGAIDVILMSNAIF